MVGNFSTSLLVKLGILFIGLIVVHEIYGQDRGGTIKGLVLDKQTNSPVSAAKIFIGKAVSTASSANGTFNIETSEDSYSINVIAQGYDTFKVSKIQVYYGQATSLVIHLSPTTIDSFSYSRKDSIRLKQAVLQNATKQNGLLSEYNHILPRAGTENASILNFPIQNSLDPNITQVFRRLPQVFSAPHSQSSSIAQVPSIAGMDSRYSQIRLNGMPIQDMFGYRDINFLQNISTDILDKVSVMYQGSSLIAGDRAGGTVDIQTKTSIDANFILIGANAGVNNGFEENKYFNNSTSDSRWLGSPGKKNNLPNSFPTTRSRYTLDQLNTQERVDQLKSLANTLPPSFNTTRLPDWGITFGIGRKYTLKKGKSLNAFFFANQWKKQLNTVSDIHVLPNVRANPYPFTSTIPIARTVSTDSVSSYHSGINMVFNIGLRSEKANYNWQNTFIKSYESTYGQKSSLFKPDEDTLSRDAIIASSAIKNIMISQLSGEHLLNAEKQFKLIWNASYAFGKETSPDTRNFTLQRDPSNPSQFQIARQSTASLQNQVIRSSNSGRSWSETNTNNFTGSIELKAPFRAFHMSQLLEGGVWFNTQYHNYFRDLYLYTRNNVSYGTIDSLLNPGNYYPTGIDVINFYKKLEASSLPFANDFSTVENLNNYVQSQNTGSVFAQLTNNLTRSLKVTWGFRLETNSQLVSNVQYQYTDFVKEPQKYTISLNSRINSLDFLPNIKLEYTLHKNISFQGGYNRSLTRPSLREMTRFLSYNPFNFTYTQGNLALENTLQDHVFGGLNVSSGKGSYLMTEVFYRLLNRPIETRVTAVGNGLQVITPYNMPTATIKGVRGNFQIAMNDIISSRFMESMYLFGSGVLQDSKVNAGPVKASEDVLEHELSGTPASIFNIGFTISDTRYPNISVSFQQIADHISSLGSGSLIALQNGETLYEIPEMRIAAQQTLNLQISQKLFKNSLLIAGGVQNLTGSRNVMYQDLNANKRFDDALKTRVANNGAYIIEGTDASFWNPNGIKSYYLSISYNIR